MTCRNTQFYRLYLMLPLIFIASTGCSNDLLDLDFRQEMVNFVSEISDYAKAVDSTFLVFPQNASELSSISGYLDAVDGIGQEDIYYGYDGDGQKTPADVTAELEDNLKSFTDAGKLVLTVDYPFNDPEIPAFTSEIIPRINDTYARSSENGFVPYCAVRELSHMTVNPGYEPEVNNYPLALDSVTDFIYILQHQESITRSQFLDSLSRLGFDLIVMDYEDEGGPYTPEEIAELKQESKAILLAYMSIGEAENYRFYWEEDWG
ncbi:hypothetical protein GF359_04790, partial [candidate division WOR-3 bacterium]|nr:hypothetical protein [candidate division WOR-3 bacterium]MBD3364512.1 hypothetical protein [candidate division WOR-3 bacterium]